MSDNITVDYKGVKITYSEPRDRWEFELRGIERSRDTLAKAKEVIDKPPTEKEEGPAFERIQAWRINYAGIEEVTVTSKQEKSWRADSYWIVDKDKRRSTEQGYNLYPRNPHNDALVEQLRKLNKAQEELAEQRERTTKKMKALVRL